ncbi:MAG: dephospho-CoA kinase [Elusimicrobiota bacterium]|nr:dephospho-CoA kinase [Elusimicrobiota bacterium]
MKKPARFVLGLTGGIGTGKSSALKAFESLGAATLCLDQIAKGQAKPGREGYRAIVKAFGPCILNDDKSINRALLGRVIFSDKRAKLGLERATHPLILKEMKGLIGKLKGLVVVDVPLLFEKKLQKNFDATMVISCTPQKQLQRIIKRDGLSSQEARLRVKAQLPLDQKRKLADVAIDNDGDFKRLDKHIHDYFSGLNLLLKGLSHGNHD